ncbi:MAG: FkbM family methyltransferase [Ruminococcus sp.]|nr:FkbM family methyltransferase [Ruminococcus sp.]
MMTPLFRFDYPNVWTALEECTQPIVLYGMGNGADKVLDAFEKRNIRAAGVMASDDFCRYQEYRGFTVKKESDFEREFGSFTVALCFGSSLPDVMQHIREVARRHALLVPNVPVIGDSLMDDAFIDRCRGEIQSAFDLLADDRSRMVFKGALDFYYTGRLEYLKAIESDKDEAFCDILRLHDERYLDLGAYRGDTADEFLHYSDGYESITAVEPNHKNFRKLCEHLAGVENATAINAGIADREGVMYVTEGGGRMAALNPRGGREVPVTTVDAVDCAPTYLKADIEGMESAMLRGAVRTLREYKPKLNLAAYHRTEDLFTLILRLHEIAPDYRIFLRKHPYIPCWDLNIYAV